MNTERKIEILKMLLNENLSSGICIAAVRIELESSEYLTFHSYLSKVLPERKFIHPADTLKENPQLVYCWPKGWILPRKNWIRKQIENLENQL